MPPPPEISDCALWFNLRQIGRISPHTSPHTQTFAGETRRLAREARQKRAAAERGWPRQPLFYYCSVTANPNPTSGCETPTGANAISVPATVPIAAISGVPMTVVPTTIMSMPMTTVMVATAAVMMTTATVMMTAPTVMMTATSVMTAATVMMTAPTVMMT